MTYTYEHAKILLKGVIADRPVATLGRYWYYATDTEILSKSDGATWQDIVGGVGGTVVSITSDDSTVTVDLTDPTNPDLSIDFAGHSVTSFGKSGDVVLGDVTVSEGSNVTITRSGNDFEIAASGGGGGGGGGGVGATATATLVSFTSSSTSPKMAGMGLIITPSSSGTVFVTFFSQINVSDSNIYNAIYYGTGTPPAHDDALTGTELDNSDIYSNVDGSAVFCSGFVTGLTPGTAYWFDVYQACDQNTQTWHNPHMQAVEIGGGISSAKGVTTATFSGASTTSDVTVSHGLASAPTVVMLQGSDDGPGFPVCVLKTISSTDFTFFVRDPTAISRTGDQTVYWFAT